MPNSHPPDWVRVYCRGCTSVKKLLRVCPAALGSSYPSIVYALPSHYQKRIFSVLCQNWVAADWLHRIDLTP